MAKLLATDLDGTLMYPFHLHRCIPKKNVKFLRRWIDEGNRLVLVTSRGPEFMDRLKKEIQRDFDYITYTSSYIVSDGKVLKDETIPGDEAFKILEEIKQKYHPRAYLVNVKDDPLLLKNAGGMGKILLYSYKLYWIFQGKRREAYILNDSYFDEHVSKGQVYKIMVFFRLRKKAAAELSKEINKEIRERYDNIECSWSKIIIEITPKNCNKGAGLEYYCNSLNINPEDVYVVGDSGNDISMFNLYKEHSYVMAKAYPSVKKYAKHVISRVHHLGKLVLDKEKENE